MCIRKHGWCPPRAGACRERVQGAGPGTSVKWSTKLRRSPLRRQRAGHTVCRAILQDGWPVLATLASCGALGQWADAHTRWGRLASAPLVSMCAALALAATGVLPVQCTTFDAVYTYVMPLAAALYMLEGNVAQLLATGRNVLAAFLLGAAGMLAGALVAWKLLGSCMGVEGAKLAACLCASYVGGSVNFAAVASATGLPPSCIPGAMAADNVAMAPLLAALMGCPVRLLGTSGGAVDPATVDDASPATSSSDSGGGAAQRRRGGDAHGSTGGATAGIAAESAAQALAAAAVAVAAGRASAAALGVPHTALLAMAVWALALSAAMHALSLRAHSRAGGAPGAPPVPCAGAGALGSALMGAYFSTIGASAGALSSLAACVPLVGFVFAMCSVHWAVMLLLGPLLRIPAPALLVGSNANVGGPGTAAGMAAARGWPQLAQPAMLCGSLGYALGTGAGLLVYRVATG